LARFGRDEYGEVVGISNGQLRQVWRYDTGNAVFRGPTISHRSRRYLRSPPIAVWTFSMLRVVARPCGSLPEFIEEEFDARWENLASTMLASVGAVSSRNCRGARSVVSLSLAGAQAGLATANFEV